MVYRFCALTMLVALLAGTSAAGAEPPAQVTGIAGDEVVKRVAVPSSERRQGEVRIVRRGATVVVQTVIHSKVMRRVAGEIAQKEALSWPDGAKSADDRARYVETLRQVVDAIRAEGNDASAGETDRFRDLRIDFLVQGGRGLVVISGAEVVDEGETLRLVAVREPVERLEPSLDYVQRNMKLIVADSFATSSLEEAERMLTDAAP